jgi:hypothetical protein
MQAVPAGSCATYFSYRETYLALLENSKIHIELWNANIFTLVPGFVAEINEELRRRGRSPIAE